MDDAFSSPGSRLLIFQGDFYCKKASTVVLRPEVCADLWKCHMILLLSRRGIGLTTQKASFPTVHRQDHGGAVPRDSIEFPTSIPNFSATTAFYWPASHVRVDSAGNKAARLTPFHGSAGCQDDRGEERVPLCSIMINCMSTKNIHNIHKVQLSSWSPRISKR
jgi:hypothetical protein